MPKGEDSFPTVKPAECPECRGMGFKYTPCRLCKKLYQGELIAPEQFPAELSAEEQIELEFIARIAAPIYAKALAPLVVELLVEEIRVLVRQERATPVDPTTGIRHDDIDHG